MYNILVFDNDTMSFNLVYMSDDLNVIVSMYNYYRKIFEEHYIIVNQVLQSNEMLLC